MKDATNREIMTKRWTDIKEIKDTEKLTKLTDIKREIKDTDREINRQTDKQTHTDRRTFITS
jgi:hypothetical protein